MGCTRVKHSHKWSELQESLIQTSKLMLTLGLRPIQGLILISIYYFIEYLNQRIYEVIEACAKANMNIITNLMPINLLLAYLCPSCEYP